jgi:hypothetical protein
MGRKRIRNEGVMSKTVKISPTLSRNFAKYCGKTAYLGGSICMEIPSNPQQFGPQTEVFKQEGYSNYRVQLSDRQELLRSSRNHDQKMTPRHRKHSNGLCSRVRISRIQAHPGAGSVLLERSKRKLSGDTKIAEFRHREPCPPRARKMTDEIRLC